MKSIDNIYNDNEDKKHNNKHTDNDGFIEPIDIKDM